MATPAVSRVVTLVLCCAALVAVPGRADEAFRLYDGPVTYGQPLSTAYGAAESQRDEFRLDLPPRPAPPLPPEAATCEACLNPQGCSPFRVCWADPSRWGWRSDPAFRLNDDPLPPPSRRTSAALDFVRHRLIISYYLSDLAK